MITKIEIDGFKSFVNFSMYFTPFTTVAGLNASGKSNLFDAIQLLSNLATMKIADAFSSDNIRGEMLEYFTNYDNDHISKEMRFAVEFLVDREFVSGEKTYHIENPRLRYELVLEREGGQKGFQSIHIKKESLQKIYPTNDEWCQRYLKGQDELWRSKGRLQPLITTTVNKMGKTIILLLYHFKGETLYGEMFYASKSETTALCGASPFAHVEVQAAKAEMMNWNFMQLDPEELRRPANYAKNPSMKMGRRGENMAAALYRLKREDPFKLQQITYLLQEFVPQYYQIDVVDDAENNQFVIWLVDETNKVFTSRVLSAGTLRLLALCIVLVDKDFRGTLCFEEPENGIHPFRIYAIKQLLGKIASDLAHPQSPLRQVIVNTHSPVFIAELEKDEKNPSCSLWMSKMFHHTNPVGEFRYSMDVTRMIPVTDRPLKQLGIPEVLRNMSMRDVEAYLASTNIKEEDKQ